MEGLIRKTCQTFIRFLDFVEQLFYMYWLYHPIHHNRLVICIDNSIMILLQVGEIFISK